MIETAELDPQGAKAQVEETRLLHEEDDDDAEADYDEDEMPVAPRHECWFSLSGFGSPEWWSRG